MSSCSIEAADTMLLVKANTEVSASNSSKYAVAVQRQAVLCHFALVSGNIR